MRSPARVPGANTALLSFSVPVDHSTESSVNCRTWPGLLMPLHALRTLAPSPESTLHFLELPEWSRLQGDLFSRQQSHLPCGRAECGDAHGQTIQGLLHACSLSPFSDHRVKVIVLRERLKHQARSGSLQETFTKWPPSLDPLLILCRRKKLPNL